MDSVVFISACDGSEASAVAALRGAGWRVFSRRLDLNRDQIAEERPDLVIVDVPRGRPVRSTVEVFLGAPGMSAVRFVALIEPQQATDAIAVGRLDDFVIRPVHVEELLARTRRLVMTDGRDNEDRIVDEGLCIDLRAWEVSVDGLVTDFTYQEFQLLSFLAGRPGRVFSRDQLLAQVWGLDYYGGSRTVDIHVRRIRAKLGSQHARAIETIRNVGYKWRPLSLTR
jgi:DNA-binding response OmpR family regulator